jgi:hypothetical protein
MQRGSASRAVRPGRRNTRLARLALAAGALLSLAGCGNSLPGPSTPSPGASSLPQQLESAHFIFYSTDVDRPVLPALADLLESHFDAVVSHLEVTMPSKVRVEVYPDLASFHSHSSMPNGPDWFIGQASGSSLIRMVSPQNPGPAHTRDSVMLAAVHELVHAASAVANPSLATVSWLCEGVAVFEAGQTPNRAAITGAVQTNSVPSLAAMTSLDGFVANNGYTFSYTIAEYVVAEYG